MEKLDISQQSKIRAEWNDTPENYSKENKNKVKNYFIKKYGVNKNNVNVIYKPVKVNSSGELIEITGANIENILNVSYQRELMKEWLKRENKTIDFNRIISLDDKVNAELNLDDNSARYTSWSIRWIMLDNFLSFGEKNFVDMNKLKGLTIVNSFPSNYGGKCIRSDTKVNIEFSQENIIKKLGFIPDELKKEVTIGDVYSLFQKYGDLGLKVETPFGFQHIEDCQIIEENADVYRCELEDGKYLEGADKHRIKQEDNSFIYLENLCGGEKIQTIDGIKSVKNCYLTYFKDTLYDIQVANVQQYYSNGIVSHNSTLTIDCLKFLLHGVTTKTDKNEQIFNTYTDKNELSVRGLIEMGGEEIIIERKMSRKPKKAGEWSITNRLNFYKILPDGEEQLLNEEDATKTTAKIKSTIGSEKDFEMLVLATQRNLDDLIGLTTTESGKLLTRLIGLEVIETKEAIVRKMFNEFDKKKKSNEYNIISLNDEISEHFEKIDLCEGIKETLSNRLEEIKSEIKGLNDENDRLLNSKITIDVSITALNPSKLETEVNEITIKGKALSAKVKELNDKIISIGNFDFDEDYYHKLTLESNKIQIEIGTKNSDITRLESTIKDLINNEICKACNRKLDDVDNTVHIETHKKTIDGLRVNIETLNKRLGEVKDGLLKMNESKVLVDNKIKLELERDRTEVEVGSLRNKVQEKNNDLKKYKLNEKAIEFNRNVDSDVAIVKTKLVVADKTKDDIQSKFEKIKSDINANIQSIDVKHKLVEQIKREDEVEKIFKVYIELVGKKGISKLVLRSVLPIINSELSRLLDEVCNFEVEIFIDDKNDVQFLLNEDGVTKLLKSGSGFEKTVSSIALRCVLGKVSTLPMPNFITFDEVLGTVANENFEKLKPFFDKIKGMYDTVFLISHNDVVKDFATNILTVVKENHISRVKVGN